MAVRTSRRILPHADGEQQNLRANATGSNAEKNRSHLFSVTVKSAPDILCAKR